MKKKLVLGFLSLTLSFTAFAGGLLTNTNQHVSFLRMIARGASIDIDGVYSNPAGLGFMNDGFYLSLNGQSAYQTRIIDASFPLFGESPKRYKGIASAPFVPSVQALYKKGDWAFSGSFAITGGGGKASFNEGLPMFDSRVMAGISSQTGGAVTSDMYTINSAMDGKQYIFGFQLGASYKINDYLSVFAGGRMNYVKSGYDGYLYAKLKTAIPTDLTTIELDVDQSGWGVTPIIGVDVKYNKWNLGLKYEFKSSLNIENKTKKNSDPDGTLAEYRDGVNTPNDIPAMFMAALGYKILPVLRATIEYHQFSDENARMANDKQKYLTGNTHEYLAGIEWDVHKIVTVSAGYQKTDYGLSDNFQSDISFSLDSYSIGFGVALKLTPKLTMNVAYFWTTYDDYTKVSENYNGLPIAGTDVYSRTNKVFGLGIDYRF
ncbi:MAG: hypothetical protein LBM67_03605 [Lentimicrobiaceae bacterium]|jgi:long-chain fatty acid transport protein|nr:hypothetical protein [Lentimicrobiaceae bacterium]